MKVELSDGNWAEVRDKLKGKDKFAIQNAVTFNVNEAEKGSVSAKIMTTLTNALLSQLIMSWSLDEPIPSQAEDPGEILGELDIDDYNALDEAIRPLLLKALQAPNHETPSG